MTRFLENIMPSTKQIWRTESTCQFEKRVQIRLFNIKLQGLADTNKCFNFDAKKKKLAETTLGSALQSKLSMSRISFHYLYLH